MPGKKKVPIYIPEDFDTPPVLRKLAEIKPYPNNPRIHTETQLAMLANGIIEFGFQGYIVLDENDVIVMGHGRLEAAKRLGMEQIPTRCITGMTEDQIKAYRIWDNRITEFGEWAPDLLNTELADLHGSGFDMQFTGFEFVPPTPTGKEGKEDNVPPIVPGKEPFSKLGDVWMLGNHRLVCGDCAKQEMMEYLMADAEEKATAVFTDPPYGVSYQGDVFNQIENDDLRGDELFNFLAATFTNYFRITGENPALYVCYASRNHIIFENALDRAGFRVKQQLIWDKGFVLGRSDYHWCHEPILYAVKKTKNCEWYGDRTHQTMLNKTDKELGKLKKDELLAMLLALKENTTIQTIGKDPAQSYVHPTQKPVKLPQKLIENSTQQGMVVADFFGGSGSTLIACEKTGRICRTMELDPVYADTIVKRFLDYTSELGAKGRDDIHLYRDDKYVDWSGILEDN